MFSVFSFFLFEYQYLDNLVGDVMNMLDDDLETSHSSNNNDSGRYTPDTANYQKIDVYYLIH